MAIATIGKKITLHLFMAEKSFTFYCLHFNITHPLTVGDTPNWYKKGSN